MTTHAELASQILRNNAGFFRALADQTPAIAEQMQQSAQTCEQVAALLEADPMGELPQPGAEQG